MKLRPVLLMLCCLYAVRGAGQLPAEAGLDSTVMLLGDPNAITIRLPGTAVNPQADWTELESLPAFERLAEPELRSEGDYLLLRLPFSVYDSTELLLPSIPIYTKDAEYRTNTLPLVVNFPPLDSGVNDYRPLIIEPLRLRDYLPWIVGGLVLLLVLGGGLWLLRRQATPERLQPASTPLLPHEVALAALKKLENEDEVGDDPFYTRLDYILRRYVEGRFGVPALERSSTDITSLLAKGGYPADLSLQQLLDRITLVKYAQASLPASERQIAVGQVRDYIIQTQPVATIAHGEDKTSAA